MSSDINASSISKLASITSTSLGATLLAGNDGGTLTGTDGATVDGTGATFVGTALGVPTGDIDGDKLGEKLGDTEPSFCDVRSERADNGSLTAATPILTGGGNNDVRTGGGGTGDIGIGGRCTIDDAAVAIISGVAAWGGGGGVGVDGNAGGALLNGNDGDIVGGSIDVDVDNGIGTDVEEEGAVVPNNGRNTGAAVGALVPVAGLAPKVNAPLPPDADADADVDVEGGTGGRPKRKTPPTGGVTDGVVGVTEAVTVATAGPSSVLGSSLLLLPLLLLLLFDGMVDMVDMVGMAGVMGCGFVLSVSSLSSKPGNARSSSSSPKSSESMLDLPR
jgi:hypothetical protein